MQPIPVKSMKPWFQTIEDVGPKLVWSQFFTAEQPVEIDIGSGRGLFLLNAALQHPERNFAGLEIDYREGRRAAERLQKRELGNARVIGGDANKVLAEMIEPGSVDAAHVYFPDPWWKTRHHKRRIFNSDFLLKLARVIRTGGHLHHWTDVADYFVMVRGLMEHSADFRLCPVPDEREAENDMDYQTSFERKKRKLGFPIYRAMWQRV
ncbi:MAG: tRNA (guanosine(46)-N7)-methyltransferase TrmB [Planctomycetia bacterium]